MSLFADKVVFKAENMLIFCEFRTPDPLLIEEIALQKPFLTSSLKQIRVWQRGPMELIKKGSPRIWSRSTCTTLP